ncbi:superfamily II DNA/RNA helicase [Streptomyces sp. Amel2xB2]|uniref:DEAD/DEAH box helicase n=1 Tax=Streptomyces sp. Amel2xB2 TaxID=1305829 RepID=UPI000DB9EFB0|nr:DEAD/DEAH box helicase [Streptomyces sp. Amel2xB2]RAJ61851.1 superfamily II DNA/RNA helicase [Streptomyces sp. Amel2xB2]
MNRTTRTDDRPTTAGSAGSRKNRGFRRRTEGGTIRPTHSRPRNRPGGKGRQQAGQHGEFSFPVTATPALPAVERFADLDMPASLLDALRAQGVTVPFPIQAAALPNALAGRDVLGRGRTGSGKTLAFGLGLLSRIAGRRAEPRQPSALVLVPTRELAQQVTDALTPYARGMRLRLATVVGGVPIGRQTRALHRGAEVLVATPGRLKDLIERGDCRLDAVAVTVLDEADQMADMGFMPQVTGLLDQVPGDGQRMLFSATLDRNVDLLVRRYLNDPVVHSVDPSAGAVATMEHHLLYVHPDDKRSATTEIAARDGRVLMFVDTKRSVDRLTKYLLSSGVRAGALHGGKSQGQRTRTLAQFKDGTVTVLVATDVAARGIHIDDLDLVVNVDPPKGHKDYLHRGGRTARAGKSGSVVTLVLPDQRGEMTRLMAHAAINPQTAHVRSGEGELNRITGARKPPGVPVVPAVTETARRGEASPRGRRGRPARQQPGRAAGRKTSDLSSHAPTTSRRAASGPRRMTRDTSRVTRHSVPGAS